MRFVRLDGRGFGLDRPASGLGWLHLAVVVLLWGSGPIAIGVGVSPEGGFGPLWLGSSRLLVAALILLVVGRLRGHALWPAGGPLKAIAVGAIGWSVGNGAQTFAQTDAPASLAALIVGLSPACAIALDASLAKRLPAPHHLLAVVFGLLGLGLLVLGDGPLIAPPWAIGLLVLAAVGWAAASVIEGRRPVAAAPSISAGWQMLAGGAGLLAAAIVAGEPVPLPSAAGWVAWAWLALACAAVGFLSWIEVLRRLPVALAMTQPTLSTVVAVWLGALLLGEVLGSGAAVGMIATLIGAALAAVPADVPRALRLRLVGRRR